MGDIVFCSLSGLSKFNQDIVQEMYLLAKYECRWYQNFKSSKYRYLLYKLLEFITFLNILRMKFLASITCKLNIQPLEKCLPVAPTFSISLKRRHVCGTTKGFDGNSKVIFDPAFL